MMGCWSGFHLFFVIFLVVFLTLFTGGISTTTSISDAIFPTDALPGRSLLQVKKSCPVDFKSQNYTIFTDQCKAPQYPPNLCCSAFKKFACPFAQDLNDLSNDCASIMMSCINLHGNYTPGFFGSQCRDGKDGLECPAQPPSKSDNVNSNFTSSKAPSFLHLLTAAFLVVSLRLL